MKTARKVVETFVTELSADEIAEILAEHFGAKSNDCVFDVSGGYVHGATITTTRVIE